jgi:hypothetical protein
MLHYLETGEVPEEGVVCETDKKPLVDVLSKRGVIAPAEHMKRRSLRM